MKKTFIFGVFVSLSSFLLAGPIGPPAGSPILNQSKRQTGAVFNVSSGTVDGINVSTITFSDGTQQITATASVGGGSSSLSANLNGVLISSPTSQIDFNSPGILVILGGSSTAQVSLNVSSVTMLGANPSTTKIPEGSNLYYTNSRATSAMSATAPLTYSNGVVGATSYFLLTSSTTLLTTSSATATYLTLSSAGVTYVQNSSASATYLQLSSAAATYQTKGSYLTTSSAAITYQPAGSYLTTSSATSNYIQISTGTNNASQLLKLSNAGLITNSLVDGSSVTKQGVIRAGTNISLSQTSGNLTISASTASSNLSPGSTMYIQNTTTHQDATLFVTSASIAGQIDVSSGIVIHGNADNAGNLFLHDGAAVAYGTDAPLYPFHLVGGANDGSPLFYVSHTAGYAFEAIGASNNAALLTANSNSGTSAYGIESSQSGGNAAAIFGHVNTSTGVVGSSTFGVGIYGNSNLGTGGYFNSTTGNSIETQNGPVLIRSSASVNGQMSVQSLKFPDGTIQKSSATTGSVPTGSSIYSATSTAVFSYGFSSTTGTFTSTMTLSGNRPVAVTAPSDGQGVVWSSANSRWQPGNISAAAGGSANQVQINVGSSLTGDAGLVYDKTTGVQVLTVFNSSVTTKLHIPTAYPTTSASPDNSLGSIYLTPGATQMWATNGTSVPTLIGPSISPIYPATSNVLASQGLTVTTMTINTALMVTANNLATIGTDQNNWSVGPYQIIRTSASTSVNITGIVAGPSNQILTFINVSTNTYTFTGESSASSSANRIIPYIINGATASITLNGNDSTSFWYDGISSRWRRKQ